MLLSLRGVRNSFGVLVHTGDAHTLQRIPCALAITQSEQSFTAFVPPPQSFWIASLASSIAFLHLSHVGLRLKSIVGDVSALASTSDHMHSSEPAST